MGFQGVLNHDEQVEALKIARETIIASLKGEKISFSPESEIFSEKAGAFVTLKKSGDLRGCIGTFSDDAPILEVIRRMAKAAAFEDPRFDSVKLQEIPDISVEISILSGLTPIEPDDVVIGKHGLFITMGFHRGVLLPQVPVEWGWDREKFLEQVCIKASLPPYAYKEPETTLESFTAQVFSE